MRSLMLLVTTTLVSGYSVADESCQALPDKISADYATAHNMSASNRTPQCQAYAVVIGDGFKESERCTHPWRSGHHQAED